VQQNRLLTRSLKLLYEYVQTLPGSSIQHIGNQSPSVQNMVEHINFILDEDGVNGGIPRDVPGASSIYPTSEYTLYNSTESVMPKHDLWPVAITNKSEGMELQEFLEYGNTMYTDTRTKHSS
jgi:hypothetical protein